MRMIKHKYGTTLVEILRLDKGNKPQQEKYMLLRTFKDTSTVVRNLCREFDLKVEDFLILNIEKQTWKFKMCESDFVRLACGERIG